MDEFSSHAACHLQKFFGKTPAEERDLFVPTCSESVAARERPHAIPSKLNGSKSGKLMTGASSYPRLMMTNPRTTYARAQHPCLHEGTDRFNHILWERSICLGLISWARGCRNSSRRSVLDPIRVRWKSKSSWHGPDKDDRDLRTRAGQEGLSLAAKEARP